MTYEELDPLLLPWAKEKDLSVDTIHRDDAVRSIPMSDLKGNTFQIWIDPYQEDNLVVKIKAWDFKERSISTSAIKETFIESLDNTLKTVRSWMNS